MNIDMVNFAITVLSRALILYVTLQIIKSLNRLYYLISDDVSISSTRIVERVLLIVIYVSALYIGIWAYNTFDITLSVDVSDILEMVQ